MTSLRNPEYSLIVSKSEYDNIKTDEKLKGIKENIQMQDIIFPGNMKKLVLEPKIKNITPGDMVKMRESILTACEKKKPKLTPQLQHKKGLLMSKGTWDMMKTDKNILGKIKPLMVGNNQDLVYIDVSGKNKEDILTSIDSIEKTKANPIGVKGNKLPGSYEQVSDVSVLMKPRAEAYSPRQTTGNIQAKFSTQSKPQKIQVYDSVDFNNFASFMNKSQFERKYKVKVIFDEQKPRNVYVSANKSAGGSVEDAKKAFSELNVLYNHYCTKSNKRH